MTTNNNGQTNSGTRTRRRTSSSGSSTADTTETTNINPQSSQTAMNPTFKLIFSTIGSLIISVLKFILAIIYSCFKLVHTICEFFISSLDEILNRLRP
ncbi:MAG: hypothetical protein QM564_06695 [Bergeyella sp.]